jgi:hypothetical protein
MDTTEWTTALGETRRFVATVVDGGGDGHRHGGLVHHRSLHPRVDQSGPRRHGRRLATMMVTAGDVSTPVLSPLPRGVDHHPTLGNYQSAAPSAMLHTPFGVGG